MADIRAALAAAADPQGGCTGITATWCPRCGECTCVRDRSDAPSLCDPRCPLHAPGSDHGEPPPADTGWRDRPPTVEEVEAHALMHDGHWLRCHDTYGPAVVCPWIAPDETVWVGRPGSGAAEIGPGCGCDDCGTRWRPLTFKGDPAPWPEVTP